MALTKCPACGKNVPPGPFCKECGQALPEKSATNQNSAAAGCGALIVLIIIVAVLVNVCSRSSGGSVPMTGSVTRMTPVDAITVQFVGEIRNSGSNAAEGQCTFEAQGAGSLPLGFDIWESDAPINPGSSWKFTGSIRIEEHAGFTVQRVVAKDCKST
ncbi:MAG: hypothetical protein U0U69_02975 [Acidimicrobiia bacterium]